MVFLRIKDMLLWVWYAMGLKCTNTVAVAASVSSLQPTEYEDKSNGMQHNVVNHAC